MAGAEPDGVRAAVLLRRDARPCRDSGADVYARSPRTLPVVLSADEVVRFLRAVPSLKTRTALTTAYAAGLRASEAGLSRYLRSAGWGRCCRIQASVPVMAFHSVMALSR